MQHIPFLREVPAETIQVIAGALRREQIEPGAVIARQGAQASALVILLEGEAQATHRTREGSDRPLGMFTAGDVFGELGVVFEQAYSATLTAVAPCTVLFWEAKALRLALKGQEAAVTGLRFAAESRRLALSRRFSWLGEEENLRAVARKDINILLQALGLPVMLLVVGIAFLWWGLSDASGPIAWSGALATLLGLGYGLWKRIDWGNDYYIVTDRRAVWLEKVIGIYDSQREAPLQMVLSVSVNTDFLGRSLGYGDVVIRTYTGQLTFRNVHDPHSMAAVIEESWRRIRQEQQREDREIVVQALKERLAGEEPEVEATPEQHLVQDEPSGPSASIGLDHWTFQVRFEEGGVITYRKHWAVLLRAIALPSALVLTITGLLGATLGGLLELFTISTAIVGATLTLLPALGWWTYRYVDWANDIYQITADQIVDVYKKPLSREMRKVAPLENILSTNVQRRGLAGLVLNFGDVVAEVGTAKFTFEGVYQPNLVQQDIVRAQEALMESRQQLERHQRREELVEWFGAYHEETDGTREGEPTEDRIG